MEAVLVNLDELLPSGEEAALDRVSLKHFTIKGNSDTNYRVYCEDGSELDIEAGSASEAYQKAGRRDVVRILNRPAASALMIPPEQLFADEHETDVPLEVEDYSELSFVDICDQRRKGAEDFSLLDFKELSELHHTDT